MERSDALAQITKKWPRLTTTKSGLMFEVLKKGSGGSPSPASQVSVNYTGTLLDGRIFDSTTARGHAGNVPGEQGHPGLDGGTPCDERGEKCRLGDTARARLRRARDTRGSYRRTPSWFSRWS